MLALIACSGGLFAFKYLSWLARGAVTLLGTFALPLQPVTLKLLVPIGISFYTLRTLGYLVDVYRGTSPAEKHFGHYAVFISFFPSIISGPIERACTLLPQIKKEHSFDYASATYGLKLIAWGFFKKLAIADVIAQLINPIFADVYSHSGFVLVLSAVLFAVQIYGDFSGYTDIALGVARLFGINLTQNFKSPYFSRSLKEFWRRWHISLSTWLRDYIYIPLGGNRQGKAKTALNLLITFLVSGLWHGANLTFLAWGFFHGAGAIIEGLFTRKNKPGETRHRLLRSVIPVLLTFTFCCFAWIFFRVNTLSEAGYFISHLFTGVRAPIHYLHTGLFAMGFTRVSLMELVLACFLLIVFDAVSLKADVFKRLGSLPRLIRWPFYVSFVLLLVALMPVAVNPNFIYFRF